MPETAKTDAERRYLLQELSEEEKIRLEEAFFADDAKFEALELAEDDLIDAYVRNELSPKEQQQFYAKILASPRLRERVNFARALSAKVGSIQSATPSTELKLSARTHSGNRWWAGFFAQPPWRIAMAAAAILILVGGLVLVAGWLRLRNESQRLASERATLQHEKEGLNKLSDEQRTKELIAELQREREQHAEDLKLIQQLQQAREPEKTPTRPSVPTAIATAFLTPEALRSGGGAHEELIIRPETTAARVQLALERTDYPLYRATLKNADEVVLFRRDKLKPRSAKSISQLLLYIPFRINPGDYVITASGRNASGRYEKVADYTLHVTTKTAGE